MIFNSYLFWVFFAAVLIAYRQLGHRAQNLLLLLASYVFYGAWDWRFLGLIFLSTFIDYYASNKIARTEQAANRWAWLLLSMVLNLGLLGVFKYYNFFATELANLLSIGGVSAALPTLKVVLPVGISFYTFQTMSYTIDVYRRVVKPTRDLLDFALYVCFFPQLVAGPIERFGDLMPQVERARATTAADFQEGLYHILIGLFKKVVIADNMAPIVNAVFATPANELTGPQCLLGVYAFAMQIYGDFSGYSSIAQGVANWLGFRLMFNFRMPYFAVSPSDFWRRWHISLSQWLRDYLYVPLGGNRGGAIATQRNLLLTMLLGGLWHGAALTFVAWGLFHGVVLCLYRPWEAWIREATTRSWLWRGLLMFVMFHIVCFGWLLFRADSLPQVAKFATCVATDGTGWSQLLRGQVTDPLTLGGLSLIAFYCLPLFVYEQWVERRGDMLAILAVSWGWRVMLYGYFAMMLWYFPPPMQSVFIYFQF